MDLDRIHQALSAVAQQQVLRFWDALATQSRQKLASQVESLDLRGIAHLSQTHVRNTPPLELPRDIQPVHAYPRRADAKHADLYKRAHHRGEELLRQGKVAAFLVAGGQGTRLGYDGPKGEFPVTPIKRKPLFQVFAEQLLAFSRDFAHVIPWYIMTSDANDAATRAFFQTHNHFGYSPKDIFFFQQGLMPAFSMDGKMLLADKDSLALSPDGHGGSLRALHKSGALDDMEKRGVEHLSYFQVDNPLVHCIDPLFIGLHDLADCEMASKTIPKAGPLEKVGNFVLADGALQVIEYSDLPDELAEQTNPDGSLRFNAGSIAIHALRVSFIRRLNAGGQLSLPWHRAEKKVPCIDESGNRIDPHKPNAVKLEQFVFDAIPLAKNAIVYTTDRAEEFSPVKNAQGVDSPATSRQDQIRRSAAWLKSAGVAVPVKDGKPDAIIEISPLRAISADQLKQRGALDRIPPGAEIYLDQASGQ